MTDAIVDALTLDLLEWLSIRDRTYQEVIDIWRTSCPRLPVWEDARDRGFIAQENSGGREIVRVTLTGFAFLQHRKRFSRPGDSRPA